MEIPAELFQLQASTINARKRTGDPHVIAQVKRGKYTVVRAIPPQTGRGKYTIEVLSDPMPISDAIIWMDSYGA